MVRPALIAAAIAALLLLGRAQAQPDAFWCGTRLIREGMGVADIVARCGEPAAIRRVEEPIYGWRGRDRVKIGVWVVEYWTYDRGSRRFPARITVEEGIATEVALLSRR